MIFLGLNIDELFEKVVREIPDDGFLDIKPLQSDDVMQNIILSPLTQLLLSIFEERRDNASKKALVFSIMINDRFPLNEKPHPGFIWGIRRWGSYLTIVQMPCD